MNDVQLSHIGGPTLLIEVGGWRLLTDPTFDAPGRSDRFGWGYEGWKHFKQGRAAIERELAGAPADVRERFRWLPIGAG